MYKSIIRPLFFMIPPESVHNMSIVFFRTFLRLPFLRIIAKNHFNIESPALHRNIAGLHFKNPVGLAAGFDKNAEAYEELSALGFGFIEIGTVTPKAQPGNPKPRIFRLKKDNALINRMGFNNQGSARIAQNLKRRKSSDIIIGGNIGKNKITDFENAISDYEKCFEVLYPYVDYFAINVSSPNTPELRRLQDKHNLERLFDSIIKLNNSVPAPKPVFIKIAPDLSQEQLSDIAELVNAMDIAGIIACNTTIDRSKLNYEDQYIRSIGDGGLSGKPVKDRSTHIISMLRQKLDKDKAIIGVGGISSAEDAIEKLNAGADLIQIYTGFIYEGPGIVKKINRSLLRQYI